MTSAAPAPLDRAGLAACISAFVMWGVFPLYWRLLQQVPALEIIAHRIVWCGLLVVGFLLLRDGSGWLRTALAKPRVPLMLAASSVLISFNWGLYIWAVNNGHVVETSLGYFINPLMNVVLGVMLLGERLNARQWLAIGLAACGVLWLTFQFGDPPWIALSLATSFAFYGFIRKQAAVDSIPGLGIESLFLLLPALALLGWLWWSGTGGHFADGDIGTDLLLVIGGAITALPLIGFAFATRRIPYSLVGILQYIAPTLQLLIGVLVFGEAFSRNQAIGFGLIWVALALYAADGIWRGRLRARVATAPASG